VEERIVSLSLSPPPQNYYNSNRESTIVVPAASSATIDSQLEVERRTALFKIDHYQLISKGLLSNVSCVVF
jgi:hypothetical protein